MSKDVCEFCDGTGEIEIEYPAYQLGGSIRSSQFVQEVCPHCRGYHNEEDDDAEYEEI